MSETLDEGDLAYMRATAAAHRTVPATLSARLRARDATGGSTFTYGEPEPLDVRLDAARDGVPQSLAERYGVEALTKITMDQARDVRSGDRLTVTPTEAYELVTDGDPDRWATAQIVYAVRQTYPART